MLKRVREEGGDGEIVSPPVSFTLPSELAPKRQKLSATRDEKSNLHPPASRHGEYRTRRPSITPRSSFILDPGSDRLTSLPHELIIRILHLLPFRCVLLCQLVSRRMRHLAGDAQVWKGLYYGRFVRPRVMRLRGVGGAGRVSESAEKSQTPSHSLDGAEKGKKIHLAQDDNPEKMRSRGPDEDIYEGRRKRNHKSKPVEIPEFSSRSSKWLDEWWLVDDEAGGLKQSEQPGRASQREDVGLEPGNGGGRVRRRKATDWKARYKLRYNWSIGAAEIQEISLRPSLDSRIEDMNDEWGNIGRGRKSLIARLGDGVVITVDSQQGLRAWDVKTRQCVAQGKFAGTDEESNDQSEEPTCLGVDRASRTGEDTGIVVGFMNGHFEVWRLRIRDDVERYFDRRWKSPNRQIDDELSAVAYTRSHLLTITAMQVLSIYVFDAKEPSTAESTTSTKESRSSPEIPEPELPVDNRSTQPRLLTSLRSQTCWPPLSLSIRSTPHSVIASIAYYIPTYLSGWSVGLQELHISPSGTILKSRLASGIDQGFQSLLSSTPSSMPPPSTSSSSAHDGSPFDLVTRRGQRVLPPSSLSYSHPYLLAGNRDNTLTLYLVTSNNEELKIGKGSTLWGHTSSVSGAQVGGRGKAVSVSTRGDELRVWELEAGLGKKMVGKSSVRVKRDRREGAGIVNSQEWSNRMAGENEDSLLNKDWVGFDDEVVIVLRDGGLGDDNRDGNEQKLVVYDFT